MVGPSRYRHLEEQLGHTFDDLALLERALTHGSYRNEHDDWPDNTQLAYIGDAVLQLAATRLLIERFPGLKAGDLDPKRQQVVNEEAIADMGSRLGLGDLLFLGAGERQNGGATKTSVLEEACEAVIAAVFIDSKFDFEKTFQAVCPLLPQPVSLEPELE